MQARPKYGNTAWGVWYSRQAYRLSLQNTSRANHNAAQRSTAPATAHHSTAHLRHVAVPVAQQVRGQLNSPPVPPVVGGRLAEHELGAAAQDGSNALGACGRRPGNGNQQQVSCGSGLGAQHTAHAPPPSLQPSTRPASALQSANNIPVQHPRPVGWLTKRHPALQLQVLHHQPHVTLHPAAPPAVDERAAAGGDAPRHRLRGQGMAPGMCFVPRDVCRACLWAAG